MSGEAPVRAALRPYAALAGMLARTFGPDCEVVLHDLTDPEHSVVCVANNTVTGRRPGDSFDQLVLQVILSGARTEDDTAVYFFRAPNGKLIRSATLLIRAADDALEGALCVNLDTTRLAAQAEALAFFLPPAAPAPAPPKADGEHVAALVTELVDRILGGRPAGSLTRAERLEKVRFMEEKGVFLMKGSVGLVAARLGVNRVTVYSDLDEIRGRKR